MSRCYKCSDGLWDLSWVYCGPCHDHAIREAEQKAYYENPADELIDDMDPGTPIRVWMKWDKKAGGWFVRANVGGWKRGETADAKDRSATMAIAEAIAAAVKASGRCMEGEG